MGHPLAGKGTDPRIRVGASNQQWLEGGRHQVHATGYSGTDTRDKRPSGTFLNSRFQYVCPNNLGVTAQLQNKDDPNLNMVPSDHPFMSVQSLEQEGLKLLEGVITTLYTTK